MIRKPKKTNPRNSDEYKSMCYAVRKRDKHKCQMPDCKKAGQQVHHIRRYADTGYGRLNPDNCILLCKSHHEQVTGNENIYVPLFLKIVANNKSQS